MLLQRLQCPLLQALNLAPALQDLKNSLELLCRCRRRLFG